MTAADIFNHLSACGANSDDIALYKRLIANETLIPRSAQSLYDRLQAPLTDIPAATYNKVSILNLVRLPDEAYYKRFDRLVLKSMDMGESDYINLFEQLLDPIQHFSANPSEISARRLFRAFDFDALLSEHHMLEGYGAQFFARTLRRHGINGRTFELFALFICFTSNNPHVIQNFLFALSATSGPVPEVLLNVLGRYEVYNSPSYDLIERVPGLTGQDRLRLIFTHLKSMDAAFYGNKLDVIEESNNTEMQRWAALNVSSMPSAQYFCDYLLAESVSDHHRLAALDHYLLAVSTLKRGYSPAPCEMQSLLFDLEARLRGYLLEHIGTISGEEWQLRHVRWRYGRLAALNQDCTYKDVFNNSINPVDTVLDAIAQMAGQPRFDGLIAAHAPDLANQSNGYTSLLRPPGYRHDLYIQAKVAAHQRWFARELTRLENGDLANWGTLTLLLQNGVQFNALSAWLLTEMKRAVLPEPVLNPLVYDALLYCPASPDMLLQARRLFAKALTSQNAQWVKQVLSALHRHRSKGHNVPGDLVSALEAVDTTGFKRLHLYFLKKLLAQAREDTAQQRSI